MTSSNIPDKTNYNKEQEDIPQNNNNYLVRSIKLLIFISYFLMQILRLENTIKIHLKTQT